MREVHISWLVAGWCLGVVIGVISSMNLPYGLFSGIGWLLVGILLLVPIIKNQRMWMVAIVLISGIFIGLWRGGVGQIGLDYYQQIIGSQVEISGKVTEDPDIDKRNQTVLRLDNVVMNGRELPGKIWVVLVKNDVIRRSDIVTVKGKMTDGFGAFAGSIYRAEIVNVERPVPGDVAVGMRDWFAERVRREVPEPQADLGLGFLLGMRRALPPELAEALKVAGLTHVIVASGYNLTILVRLSRRLFVKSSKYLSMLSSVAMILAFMAVTGFSPSMSRAGLVAGFSLAAWYYGRKIHPFVLLPFSAAITLLINPQFGWNDLGWQLSFMSFMGVIILAPLLQKYFFGDKEPGSFRQILGETLSAQIMTLPLIVLTFGLLSNVALIANMLILPFVPMAMLLTFLVGIFAGVPIVADLLAKLAEWLLGYMIWVADWLANQSWAQMEVQISGFSAVIMYMVLGLAIFYMARKTKFKFGEVNVIE
jgi:competence protein ComEC